MVILPITFLLLLGTSFLPDTLVSPFLSLPSCPLPALKTTPSSITSFLFLLLSVEIISFSTIYITIIFFLSFFLRDHSYFLFRFNLSLLLCVCLPCANQKHQFFIFCSAQLLFTIFIIVLLPHQSVAAAAVLLLLCRCCCCCCWFSVFCSATPSTPSVPPLSSKLLDSGRC